MGKERHRSNAKELTYEVLRILWEKTDGTHPISVKELCDILEKRLERRPDRKTVASILKILAKQTPSEVSENHRFRMGDVRHKVTDREDEIAYCYHFYMDRGFTDEEVEMLVNDVMFSRMRTQKQAKETIDKLKELAGEEKRKELAYTCVLPYSLYTANELVQKNIAFVQKVILGNLYRWETERVVSFRFNGYGADKKLHEVPEGRYENFRPLKIVEACGSYYMVGLMDGRSTPWNFRLDLVTRLVSVERPRQRTDRRERAIQKMSNPNELSQYLTEHLYMAYETEKDKPTPVSLRVEKIPWKPEASMTIVHDAFGQSYEVLQESDEYTDIRVTGVLWGITSFVRQNMDRVKVIGPEAAKEQVDAALRADFEHYFQPKGEN